MARNSGDYTAVDINGINHTDKAINYTHINGYGGPNIGPFGDGGGYCCVMLPDKWHSGLKARVEWRLIQIQLLCLQAIRTGRNLKHGRKLR